MRQIENFPPFKGRLRGAVPMYNKHKSSREPSQQRMTHGRLGNKKNDQATCPETILLTQGENAETRHDHGKEHIKFTQPTNQTRRADTPKPEV